MIVSLRRRSRIVNTRTNVILGGYFKQFHSLTETPLEFFALQRILVFFLDAVTAIIAISIPTTAEAEMGTEMRRLGSAGAGTGVGSGKGTVGARAYLEGLAALEGGVSARREIEVGMRRCRGRGRGGVGSEARERSKTGTDIGEGGRRGWRGRWRGLWGRKPVVEGEASDVGGDSTLVVEVSLGADDVNEKIRVTVFPEF